MKTSSYWFLAGALLLIAAQPSKAQDQGLEQRMAAVAQSMQTEIGFEERRHSDILQQPAIYLGELRYDRASGLMTKHVESPQRIEMQVSEREVRIIQEGRSQRFSLRQRPEMRALLATFRALLESHTDDLKRYFTLSYSEAGADLEHWRLTLTPRHRELARRVDKILINGRGAQVDAICTYLANGDWQSLALRHEVAPDMIGNVSDNVGEGPTNHSAICPAPEA